MSMGFGIRKRSERGVAAKDSDIGELNLKVFDEVFSAIVEGTVYYESRGY
jgi:hypothetical protein